MPSFRELLISTLDCLSQDPRISRLLTLLKGMVQAPPGLGRKVYASSLGIVNHALFASGVCAMMAAMFFGMSQSFGTVPEPCSHLANAALLLQFPLSHSLLLTKRGGSLLAQILPNGGTVATTTYATIASVQLFILFALWTPSDIIWWQAEGAVYWMMCTAYASAWLILAKASFDAGAEVQSGALGWMSLFSDKKPIFPPMPTLGLFKLVRQPIYLAFSFTLWTVPVWTPDQLVIAVTFTAYCLLAPIHKERRFKQRYGDDFENYRNKVPYAVPSLNGKSTPRK